MKDEMVEQAHRTGTRFRIGRLPIDALTLTGALDAIEGLVNARCGGAVYTPNVDHVVSAETNAALHAAYQQATLSLADGMPLVWVAPLLGARLPERVAGSDLFVPLMQRAAERRWRVYLLGGGPGVAAVAAARLASDFGVDIVGWDSPMVAPDGTDRTGGSLERVHAANPDILIVALGNPKQELWIARAGDALGRTVALGLGAALDFLVGHQKRAPRWMARAGFEWLYRLVHEPARLGRRYLVRDPQFVWIVARCWWSLRRQRLASTQQVTVGGIR